MRDDVHTWVAHRAEVAVRQLVTILSRAVVQRCHHDVERFERRGVQVQLAIGQDVHFHAVQDREAGYALLHAPDFVSLALESVRINRTSGCRMRRVIRDRDVLVAKLHGSPCHGLHWIVSVAPVGVHVEVSADVPDGEEVGSEPCAARSTSSVPRRTSGGMSARPSAA